MNKLLFRFFIINKKLSLPNIGMLSYQTEEAKDDFVNRTITPKLGKIVFTKENDETAEKSFKNFAQTEFQILPQEIDRYFQGLAEELKNTNCLTLDALGILTKKNHQFEFEPSFSTAPFFQPVIAKRVIRKASKEIDEVQHRSKSYGWIYVLVALIIAGAGYAFYYFYFAR